MKFVVAFCLFGVALAFPQGQQHISAHPDRNAIILSSNSVAPVGGSFSYDFEADNGIAANSHGSPGSQGQANVEGSYRYELDDGSLAEVRYIADEFGFRAEGPLIPTPHPLPAHAIEQLRIAEEQRAAGITFE